jgi:hypothetical protein
MAREVCATRRPAEPPAPALAGRAVPAIDGGSAEALPPEVGREDWAVVRGILNEDQGGPLPPPGVRMAEA